MISLDIEDKEESRFKKRKNSEAWRERERNISRRKKKEKAEKTNWKQDGYLSRRWRRTPCSLIQIF